jgi:tetrahydromethanopterin S-methyltransferase subunit H
MKMLHFVDSAGSDENFFPAKNCVQIKVASTSSVVLQFNNGDSDISSEVITLTTSTNKADEVALRMAEEVGAGQIQYGGVLKCIAATAPFADVTTVAYTAGS